MNNVILSGRLTKDPELRYTTKGTAVATFILAVPYKEEHTDFLPIVTYGKTAENIAQYKKQGDYIIVSGRLNQNTYQTKDGEKKSKIEVVGEKVEYVKNAKREDGAANEINETLFSSEGFTEVSSDEEIPF